MALPVILVNSATGSDSAASGAGPATALTGSSASTSGTGLVVTLDGSPNLSGVATDGSHVIYLNDSTANARNFGKITAADNTAKTVTVSDAFGLSLSGKSWAIGGVRASINANGSEKLWSTSGSTAGDVMPGWTVRMQSGHAESGALITMRRGGNLTAGGYCSRGRIGGRDQASVYLKRRCFLHLSRQLLQILQFRHKKEWVEWKFRLQCFLKFDHREYPSTQQRWRQVRNRDLGRIICNENSEQLYRVSHRSRHRR